MCFDSVNWTAINRSMADAIDRGNVVETFSIRRFALKTVCGIDR